MPETNRPTSAKRRLDLSSGSGAGAKPKVRNPYLSKDTSKPTSTGGDVASSTVTPEAGIEKFFVSKRDGDKKPRAARKLVTPRKEPKLVSKGRKRAKSPDVDSVEEDPNGLYYHSDDGEKRTSIRKKKEEAYDPPGHMHSSLDYHRRGELPLGQGTLKAYRFVREHFLIPRDIEADPRFGAYSGSCFEERVIRAYSLGQLEPKGDEGKDSLLVCSYCGEEGHKRDDCSDLL